MEIYVIPPNSKLELMHQGDRYFCLAQQYIKDWGYREFFHARVKEGKWVTLDNGSGDHDIVTEDALITITKELMPSEVIPPDTLFHGIKTIRDMESFIHLMKVNELIDKVQIFGCPQGRDKDEWMFVYEYMMRHPLVSTIGFSKIAIPKAFLGETNDRGIMEARHICYNELKLKGLIRKPIHLLGLGSPEELLYYKNDPLIRSNDSCNSIWSAMNCIEWDEGHYKRIPTPKDYFEREMTSLQETLAIENIEWLKDQVKTA